MVGWLDSIGATAITHFLFVISFLQVDALGLHSIFYLFLQDARGCAVEAID